jgi:hypothetical protein
MGARKRLGWVLLGLLAGGGAVSGQTKETLACVARLELSEYDSLARAARIQGRAEASFTVGADGSPTKIGIEAAHVQLKSAVLKLLAKSKFKTDCVGVGLSLRVSFSLHEPRTRFGTTTAVLVAPDLIEVTSNLPDFENQPATTDRDASSPR